MKWLFLSVFIICLTLSSFAQERTTPIFVSTQWLADHLNDPDIVILHVAFNRGNYAIGHIPGAQYLWNSWLAPSTPDLSTEIPPIEQADTVMEKLGINPQSKIVLYFTQTNITTTTRMFLTFTYFGFGDQTSVLNGGFETWKAEKRAVSTQVPIVKQTSLELHPIPSVVTDADWVKENLSNPNVAVIDARDKNFFDGNGGGVLRTGHIKGAKNIPYTTVVDSTNKLKDMAALQKMFDSAGVKKGMKVVTYCHVGQQATVLYAVAKMLGYDAALYDGCFEDWNVRGDDYPVEKTIMTDKK